MAAVSDNNSAVRVAVRLRPLVKSEIERGCKNILEVFKDLKQVQVKDTERAFTYNFVFDTDCSQCELYEDCVKNMIPRLFEGFNVTILAYGQTGSGKTHSMGTAYNENQEMGIIPRSVKEIFAFIKDNFSFDFTVSVSFIELYQEVLYDLLSDKPRDQCSLDLREDPQRGILMPGLTEVSVENAAAVIDCLIRGSNGRATGSTNMNSHSSRSHAIFTINICMQARGNSEENRTAKFHLVDLAGSERQKKTGAVGTTFKEGVNINKGLLVLGNVISALGEDKNENRFIPYRDSNLTRLLKDSLGGNSITLMIACVSPADYNIDETLSTLRYADRARRIKNKPIVNQDPKTAQINELKKTVKMLQLQLIGQGGVSVPQEQMLSAQKEMNEMRVKIQDLTHQLSLALNAKSQLLEKSLILQNSNELLTKKILELKETYNSTLHNVTEIIEQNNVERLTGLKEHFDEIKKKFDDIDSDTKKTEDELKTQESNMIEFIENTSTNVEHSKEIIDVQENYATRQIELNHQLDNITRELALKELLAKKMGSNVQNLVDYDVIRQYELRIQALEKEKNEHLKTVSNNVPSRLAEERRKKVKELEIQIQALTKQLNEQNRLIRIKEKDESKMKLLHQEIVQMKQNKVKLIRTMREESERFRTWKLQKDREVTKLKQEDVKKKNQIRKMQDMHIKQQNVLKRKVEQAVAANKRLKDAMMTRKTVQEQKFSGKLEKVTSWLKRELEVLLGLTEIEVSLSGLIDDRALLQKQLDVLKSDSNPDLNSIKTIEEDIELRSVQIQDMQQKLLDADESDKNINVDNLQTMSEAKQAVKVLIGEIQDLKRKETGLALKSLEIESNTNQECNEKKSEEKIKAIEEKYNTMISNIEQEYSEKITILLRQLRGDKDGSTSSNSDEIEQRNKIIEMQQVKIEELEKELEQQDNKENTNATVVIPVPVMASKEVTPVKKRKLVSKEVDLANLIPDDSPYFDYSDDCDKDPDWVKTPFHKRIWTEKKKLMKSRRLVDHDATTDRANSKRTSEGGCACQTTCSKRCGCRRATKECSRKCKCSFFTCTNRMTNDEDRELSTQVETV